MKRLWFVLLVICGDMRTKFKKLVLILFERSPITVLSTYQLPPLVHWSPTLNLDRIFDVLNKSYWLEYKMDGHWLKQSIKQTWNILVDIPWNKTVLKYKSAGSWSLL